jgi:two-component system, NarL family, nitrate/nitrite response regulator NarL
VAAAAAAADVPGPPVSVPPRSAYDRTVTAGRARVRVVVADDHPLFREAVVRAVRERPDFELVGEAADGRQALEAIRELEPDVAVLDVKMPDLDGLQVLNAVLRDRLPTRIVLLSAFLDGPTAYEAVATGAAAFLSKDADRSKITDTVAAVARGETVLAPEVQAGLAEEIRLRGDRDRPALSQREREVLEHIAAGRSAPEIAKLLYLSPATVKSHLQALYEKLGVSERAAAVAEAMRRGLIE